MIITEAFAECDGCGFRYQEAFDEVMAAVRTVEAAGWKFYGGATAVGPASSLLLCKECEDQR